jgi:hypothetical protein
MWQLINKQMGNSHISNQVIVLKTDSEKNINSLNVDDWQNSFVIYRVEDLEFHLTFPRHFRNYGERSHKIWVNNRQRKI